MNRNTLPIASIVPLLLFVGCGIPARRVDPLERRR